MRHSFRPFATRGSDEEPASGVWMGSGKADRCLSAPRLVGPGADGVVHRPAEAQATGCARGLTDPGDGVAHEADRSLAPGRRSTPPLFFVPRPGRIAMSVELIPKKPPARRKPPSFADYRTRPTPRRVANSGSVARKSGLHFSGSAARQGRKVARQSGSRRMSWCGSTAALVATPHPVPLPSGARGRLWRGRAPIITLAPFGASKG
jgi:hypothetical protein